MLSHTTWLISKMEPFKYIFEKTALTGRIARWQVLLSEFESSFRTLKERLTAAPILVLPNLSESFVVYYDASKMGLGGVLM